MGMIRFGVVVFPGSNCDTDTFWVVRDVLGCDARYVWHTETDISDLQCVILPGGFSYGDYLRAGSMAAFSPVMSAICDFAQNGGLVLGICNGFQILLEVGLLPGALIRNTSLKFICKTVSLSVENTDTPFTYLMKKGDILKMPIAHGYGNFYANDDLLSEIEKGGYVVFRYFGENPNGSKNSIAGIVNKQRNVLGMMPHPERASERILGSESGIPVFRSIIKWLVE
jgi:phosphoribosylformylglycinamidine synthase